jgi:cell division protein FtsB
MVALFFMVIYFMMLFSVIGDLFRDHGLNGFAKFLWVLFLLVAPFLSLFLYLIIRGDGMAKRGMAAQAEMQQQMDAYVKQTASGANPTEQIAQAKKLLDDGAISQQEFDDIKKKALA